MNGVILYQSKYGATKRYADWLSEETGFQCIETRKADINEIVTYDTIILGGGLYASGIAGLSFLKKYISKLTGKKIIVFCCGASPYEENAFQQIKEHNFKDRTLCNLLRKSVAKKNPADYEIWEKALMAAGDHKCDWTDKKCIEPIIECINQ